MKTSGLCCETKFGLLVFWDTLMFMVKFSPPAQNFAYDFVLLVHFLGQPVYNAHTSCLFSGQSTILYYCFCCLLKEMKLSWMLSFICLVLYFLCAYFTKFTNPYMYVFSTRKYFEPLLCTLTHRIILFNSGLQKFCNPAIPE